MEDRLDRLIRRAGDIVDLICAVVVLYLVLTLAGEFGNLVAFMRTWQGGW